MVDYGVDVSYAKEREITLAVIRLNRGIESTCIYRKSKIFK